MKYLTFPIIAFGIALGMVLPATVHAADPKLEGTFSNWSTYSRVDGGDTICYALTKPTTQSPSSVRHGDVYFMVANWKSGAASEQPSFLAGYPLKASSPPVARVGSTKLNMYVSQNEAFIEDGKDEKKLIKSMRAGSVMRVQAMSGRGTNTSYEFSLKGVTAALRKAKAVCG